MKCSSRKILTYTAALAGLLLSASCSPDTSLEPALARDVTPAFSVGEHGGGPPGSIVFSSQRDGNKEIYVMNADGSDPRRVTSNTADDYYPDLSPNGKQVVFTSKQTGNAEIFVADLDGGNSRNLSNNSSDDDWARWSPNGQQVVFHSNRDGNYELYLVNVDGTGLARLTNYSGVDQWPDWSPDGKRIALRRDTDVYVLDVDGGNLERLTNLPATVDQMAVWSPNGKQLVFMSFREGYCSVFTMNADGSDPVNLTPKAPADPTSAWCSRAPSWSRTGSQIYFMSFRPITGGSTAAFNEIFVMNADGSDLVRLTYTAGEDGGPRAR